MSRGLANESVAMDMTTSAHTRTVFDTDLHDLMRMVAEMGGLAEQQIEQASEALAQRNPELAHQVINRDSILDAFQAKIEEKGINIIAQRQPLAIDLRAAHFQRSRTHWRSRKEHQQTYNCDWR